MIWIGDRTISVPVWQGDKRGAAFARPAPLD
jgi:hypothetical protein